MRCHGGCRLRVDVVAVDRLAAAIAASIAPSRASAVERRHRDVVAVHLEEAAQRARGSRCGRSRRCRAPRSGPARRRGCRRRRRACSRSRRSPGPGGRRGMLLDVAHARGSSVGCRRFQRSTSRPSRRSSVKLVTLQTSACDAEVLLQQLGRGQHLAQDRAAAEQLHARALLARAASRTRYMPRRIPSRGALGHRRLRVVLVEHGEVVEDVLAARVACGAGRPARSPPARSRRSGRRSGSSARWRPARGCGRPGAAGPRR